MKKILLAIICLSSYMGLYSQFTTGNIVVLEVGDGVTPLTSAANPMALHEYTTAGVSGITVNIPSTGSGQHTMSGSATSEGLISLSGDQTRIIIPGYAAPAGTLSIASTSGATVSRAVASVDATGNYVQNALSSTFFSGNNIRSAASNGSNTFWATGGNTGYCYFGNGTPSLVSNTSTNNRATAIVADNIFFSSGAGTRGIYQISGTPTSGPQIANLVLPTGATSSPFQFAGNLASGVVYVADDRNTASGGGIQKWVFAGTWTLAYTFDCGSGFGARGLIADFSGPNPVLYATTSDGTANRLITFTDMGAPSPFTLLATASANKIFRGLVFAPIVPPTIQFATAHQSVLENAGSANITFNMTSAANAFPAKVILTTSVHTTATIGGGFDYTLSTDTVTFPAGVSTPQNFVVTINDDALPENAEYISFKVASTFNATVTGANQYHILYIRDNDYTAPTATNEVMLQVLTSYSTGTEGANSAEIVAYDSASQKLVTANSINNTLDIIDFTNPSSPGPINSIDLSLLGGINSVAVYNSIIAVALEDLVPQNNGKILFYDMTGTLISQVDAGAMPDMITFNHAGTKVYAACEGEPNASYASDPEGTIAVVDISGGVASVTNGNVTLINFNSFDSQIATLRSAGVRIFGNNGAATVSQDFEPEYITISDDDSKAWVSLQENNALAVINLLTNTVTDILPLGTINHSLVGNGMDASNQTSGINIANFPVYGVYMPDAISHLNVGGTNYIFTANEGDARAYSAPNNEESRISALSLDPTVFVDQNILKSNFLLGRLNATNKTGDIDSDGDIDQIHVYGGRGFSVWSETGTLIFNSGNLLEKIIANDPTFSGLFNANHGSGAITIKDRSDDKGPEIEGVTVANIDGDNLLFASAERLGGVFIFNIDNPASPRYIGYYNNRSIPGNAPDRGAEGILYISAAASPNGNDLVILANEISSTLTIFQVNTCASLSNVDVNYTANDSICVGDDVTFSTSVGANTNLQWLMNNGDILGETGTSTIVDQAGNYSLAVQNTALLCSDTTAETTITVIANPTASIATTDSVACAGDQLTLDASGGTPTWNNGITDNTPFTPATTDYYVATVANAFGCIGLDSILVTVNSLPNVLANVTDNDICTGASVTFNGANAVSYLWDNGVTDNVSFTPASTNTYTVTGTDANLCSNTATVTVTVNSLPSVGATVTDNEVCAGVSVTFNGTNAVTYLWDNGVTDNVSFTPASTNTYTVTGTDANLCSNTATVTVTVNSLPNVGATVTDNDICAGASVTFNGTNAVTYLWDNGVTDNVSFTPASTNTYTVTGTDANLCSNTATVTVTVNSLPSVTFNLSVDSVCTSYAAISLSGTPSGGTFTGTGVTGSNFNPATGTGTYTITYTYTDGNGCVNTDNDNLLVSGCLDIYNENSVEVSIYPNPTENFIYVRSTNEDIYTMYIYDMNGRVVLSNKVANSDMIDLSFLSGGAYQVELINNDMIYRSKLIKK